MPPQASTVTDLAHTIQLAIAPVFLLTAVGTILGVLSTRLARIVDRARVLRGRLPPQPIPGGDPTIAELALLVRRRQLVNLAITCGVSAALLVCLLIATLFVGSLVHANVSPLVAALFVLAMVAIVGALTSFLREIFLASGALDLEVR
jgi:uncharacterized protein DUF2721